MTAPTEPTEPTSAAPATEPAAPTTPATTGPTAPAAFDPNALPPEAQAYLNAQIAAADLKARTGSKANAAAEAKREMAATVAKALGLVADEPPTPEVLTAHLEDARDRAWTAQVQLQLYRVTGAAVADQLLDSMAFLNSLDDIDGEPGNAAFDAALKAKALEHAARFGTTGQTGATGPRPDPTQGARGTQAPDLEAQIAVATKAGDWRKVISLNGQKLAAQTKK